MTRYSASIEVLQFDSIKILETASDATTCVISAHGAEDGEFVVNITRSTNPPIYYSTADSCRRKVMSATTSQFNVTASISGQTTGDVVALYKYKDVTQYLKDGTLKLDLNSRGNSEASFTVQTPYLTPKEFIYTGGWDEGYVYGNTYGFNLVRRTWETKAISLVAARHNCTNVNDKMYMMQGQTYSGGWVYRDDTTEYTLSTDSWDAKTDSGATKAACMCATIGDYAYVHGGADGTPTIYDTIERYDPGGDSWVTLTAGSALVSGTGINLCDIFFVAYARDGAGFLDSDVFYVPYTDTWHTFFINHSIPNRIYSALSMKNRDFTANLLGGCSSVDGNPEYSIDYHTSLNFITKTYHENEAWWQPIQEPAAGNYEDYGAVCGGMNDTMFVLGSYLDSNEWWIKLTDDSFYYLDVLPTPMASGQGVAL
jgi:hypothetical protein